MRKADSVAIWTYEVARRLAAHHEVVVYGRCFPGQAREEEHEGVLYRRIELHKPIAKVQKLVHRAGVKPVGRGSGLYEVGYALRLAEELAQEVYDVVHVHNLSQYASLLRPVLPKSALVLHMHCEWLSQIARRTAHSRLHKVDRVLGCSEYVRDRLAERFPELSPRAGIVHNGVDLDAFGALEPSPPPPPDGGTVLFVGRISPEKGVHDLVAAFSRLLRTRPRAELRLVGPHEPTPRQYIVELADDPAVRNLSRFYPGNYLDQIQSRMDSELRARVCFVGEVQHRDLAAEYERADVLVNPSLSEAFGMSLVEAMAASVPVVATWVGGMSHVLEEGKSGLLVPPASPEALERAIARILQDDELRAALIERGRRSARERYAWPSVVERTRSEYERSLEGP
jgi:glycosyltransferase involved in cell wall biosynthesis